jgi:hypothetical protein
MQPGALDVEPHASFGELTRRQSMGLCDCIESAANAFDCPGPVLRQSFHVASKSPRWLDAIGAGPDSSP